MSLRAEIITTVCAVSAALTIGYMMQRGDVAEQRYGANTHSVLTDAVFVGEPVAPDARGTSTPNSEDHNLDIRHIELTSGRINTAGFGHRTSAATDAFASEPASDVDPSEGLAAAVVSDCTMEATVAAVAGAMVEFKLTAPCHANQRATFEHAGLRFSEAIAADGTLVQFIPALSDPATIRVSVGAGEPAIASIEVPNVMLYDRVVIQSDTDSGIEMHAREYGADYGEHGHVWSGAGRTPSVLSEGHSGFLTSLGNSDLNGAQIAQVYTFPAARTTMRQSVNLTLETPVTPENCETKIVARATQIAAGRMMSAQDLTLAMPDCDAIGQFLVLNNLLQDLTVAAK